MGRRRREVGSGQLPGDVLPILAAVVLIAGAGRTAATSLPLALPLLLVGVAILIAPLVWPAPHRPAAGGRASHSHPVTGLPTREHLFAAIDGDAAGVGLLGAIRFADLDRLAAFDPAGADAALAALATRLRAAAGPGDLIAQVDRDCVAIWFGTRPPEQAIVAFRALVRAALQSPSASPTPAIDAGLACRAAGDAPTTLLTRAIVTMRRAEVDGSGEPVLAGLSSIDAVREQLTMEQDLALAIDAGQLTMLFQPVVNVLDSRVIGAEALLRWDHPVLGPVSPERFIPLVEALGLGDRYGAWVLDAAVREAARWRAAGCDGLCIAVNLSARQLLDPGLLAMVVGTLQRHGLPANMLELELTETAAMVDAERTLRLFGELREAGVGLAIDDFGSGYSSLTYLKNLPFTKLKIDREFVRGAHERRDSLAICRALLELGRGLELSVLAEGVEDAEEVRVLRDLGCALFQGFFFAHPLTGDAFAAVAADPGWVAARLAAPAGHDSERGQFSVPAQAGVQLSERSLHNSGFLPSQEHG